jgi:hypothetical protein
MTRAVRFGLATLMTAAALASAAQPHPMEARGFAPDKVFDVHDIDSVNTFSGNLLLHIPIGPEFHVNGSVGYRYTLFYNSHSWRYVVVDNTSQGQSGDDLYDKFPDTTTYGDPVPRSNAGFGWYLSLGRLWERGDLLNERITSNYTYESPDGLDHDFSAPAVDSRVLTTNDGTFMRLTVVDGSYDSTSGRFLGATTIKVERGDGSYEVYRRYRSDWSFASNQPSDYASHLWRLHEIHEYRYDGQTGGQALVTINYANDTINNVHFKEIWTVTGGGQTSMAYFKDAPSVSVLYPSDANIDEVLDHIDLPAFGGGTATYTFNTTTQSFDPGQGDDTGRQFPMPRLDSINFPQQTLAYQFTTHTANDGTGYSGDITHVQLPTGGSIEYEWMDRDWIPGQRAKVTAPSQAAPVAVWKRTVTDPSKASGDPARTAMWEYDFTYGEIDNCWCNGHDCPLTRDMIISTTRPDGNTELAYYSVYSPLNQVTRPGDPAGTCLAGD